MKNWMLPLAALMLASSPAAKADFFKGVFNCYSEQHGLLLSIQVMESIRSRDTYLGAVAHAEGEHPNGKVRLVSPEDLPRGAYVQFLALEDNNPDTNHIDFLTIGKRGIFKRRYPGIVQYRALFSHEPKLVEVECEQLTDPYADDLMVINP